MSYVPKELIQLGIFMICAQVLVHFTPGEAYEKYIKLLVGLLFLAQLLEPFSRFGGEGTKTDLSETVLQQMEEIFSETEQQTEGREEILKQLARPFLSEEETGVRVTPVTAVEIGREKRGNGG